MPTPGLQNGGDSSGLAPGESLPVYLPCLCKYGHLKLPLAVDHCSRSMGATGSSVPVHTTFKMAPSAPCTEAAARGDSQLPRRWTGNWYVIFWVTVVTHLNNYTVTSITDTLQ